MSTSTSRLDMKGIVSFTLIAYGLAWLIASPLWISGQGLRHPLALPLMAGMMFAPSIAALIVTRFISRPAEGVRAALGMRLGKGRRWGWYWLFAWLAVPLIILASIMVGAALGLITLDLAGFSGYRALLEQAGAGATLEQLPIQALVLIQLATAFGIAPLINAIPALGEELGWRGYLLPQLLPLGQWPALLISGAIWGLWHAPVILLGYNYPQHPQLGVLLMVGFCMIWGVIFGWLRLATGSVWPAMLAHAALNGIAGATVLLLQAGTSYDTALAGPLGLAGWILPLLLIGLLAAAHRLPARDAPDAERDLQGASPAAETGLLSGHDLR
ncbi:CPBP family intramembrane metalloprotease [Oscillochloris sp. ZM17-4]|uniref:CPBP family intramembrane glutamic endopeptidase n=1 Tax=Oscillochloris sp. ZM17-4 TaxID=2866714 RepID=UPI001C73D551|nr:CPBP family intramembrane glutamic endopeptidase [Oscillochloris sp. ZM17-4]MBX0329513.1 CPBP family intramembrane metalloprotease [Oscillochloris sp. ZM17-4]